MPQSRRSPVHHGELDGAGDEDAVALRGDGVTWEKKVVGWASLAPRGCGEICRQWGGKLELRRACGAVAGKGSVPQRRIEPAVPVPLPSWTVPAPSSDGSGNTRTLEMGPSCWILQLWSTAVTERGCHRDPVAGMGLLVPPTLSCLLPGCNREPGRIWHCIQGPKPCPTHFSDDRPPSPLSLLIPLGLRRAKPDKPCRSG